MDDLITRKKLPPHLCQLLEEFPRAGWDSQIGHLSRFWLDRHLLFRRLMGEIRTSSEAALDKKMAGDVYAKHLARYGSILLGQLHEHHTVEDVHYFPRLAKREKSLKKGFALLDKDHHALDSFLHQFAEKANGLIPLKGNAQLTAIGGFHSFATDFERLVSRHLEDEEDIIIPVLLKHGEDWLG